MRILVIGGTGFIGPWVARELDRLGHSVAIVHRGQTAGDLPASVERIRGARSQFAELATRFLQFAPDVVVDMILSSERQARELTGLFRGVAGRIVALSSMDVYRACGVLHRTEPGPLEPMPLTEGSPLRQNPPYPKEAMPKLQKIFTWVDDEYDKVGVERALAGVRDLPATILRLPMVHGPGDPLHRFFPVIKRVSDGRRAILLEETVAQWRGPRGYVENVAHAVALAVVLERAAGRTYNVAEPESFTELELTRRIASLMDWQGEILALPAEHTPTHLRLPGNFAQHWVPDTRRIRSEPWRKACAELLPGNVTIRPRKSTLRNSITPRKTLP